MTLPVLSPMQPEDLDAIMPLERVAFADPWSRRMYLSDLADNPLATYRVIRSNGGPHLPPVLGWGGFWLLVDEAHIATIASHPEHRGCGLGEWLLVDLMERAVERGAHVATLEVRAGNLVAQKLYAKLGFDVVGTRRKYYRDGEDGFIMTTPALADPEIVDRIATARVDALARIGRCFEDGA